MEHLDGAADPHAQFLEAMHIVVASQKLVDRGALSGPEQRERYEFVHGGKQTGQFRY
ncbi:MAG: hypothetical protein L0211_14130 [Planctomycetaceae bacterium]|nr:hypothetical protein [Planctomycetaceae bacterium]